MTEPIPHFYTSTPGWFDWQETYRRWIAEAPEGATFVEVGCFKGRSFSFLGVEAVNSGKALHLHAVDTWQGSPELQRFADVSDGRFYSDWEMTKARLLVLGVQMTEHRMPSVEAAAHFADNSVDRIWLDGDHSTAGLLADLHAWWPKLKPGGELGGHDFGSFGVKDAIDRFSRRIGVPYEVLTPCPEAGTTNVARSFLLRKAAPVTSWAVPEGERSVLVTLVSNHPFVPRQSAASLGVLMLHAREMGATAGFRVHFHWASEAFTLDTLRDDALYQARREGHSHVLFLDADNIWPHDLLARLLPQHDLGIVGGLYHLKTAPHEPVALRRAEHDPNPNMYTRMPHIHEEQYPVEVDALGMGCTLIPMALVRQLEAPWFQFQRDEFGRNKITEDIWFCQRASTAGCRMFIDPTINVGHVAHTVIGVRQYEPFVGVVERAHRKRARALAMKRAEEGA